MNFVQNDALSLDLIDLERHLASINLKPLLSRSFRVNIGFDSKYKISKNFLVIEKLFMVSKGNF